MKLFSKLAVAFLFVVTLLSCSKDEEQPAVVEQPSLVGKWTFDKQAYFVDVPEDPAKYRDYAHGCVTTKDSRVFGADNMVNETFYWNGCDQSATKYTYKWGWKEAGKTIFVEEVSFKAGKIYEILQLDATTLKLKLVQTYGYMDKNEQNKAYAYNYFILKR